MVRKAVRAGERAVMKTLATKAIGKAQAMVGAANTPPPWMDPAHMLTTPPASPAMQRKIEDTKRAHSVMVTPEGNLHPIILTGYLQDPLVPWLYMSELNGGELRAATRAEWGTKVDVLMQVDVHSAGDEFQLFNPFGSLLACDMGFELEPLYGCVFFTRVSTDGVINKLSMQLKELLAFKMLAFHSVTEGIRPDFMDADQYLLVWSRLKILVEAHGRRAEDSGIASVT